MTIATEPIAIVKAPVKPVKTTADVLRGAARLLEEFGWCQLEWESPTRRMCASGAINMAASGDANVYSRLGDAAKDEVRRYLDYPMLAWNDTPGRTAAEVIAALRAAADAA